MSRDWTPLEEYLVEQHSIKTKTGLGSKWDYMKKSKITINGEIFPVYSEESIAKRQQYPYLGRFYAKFDKLYSFLSQVPGGLDLLARHDNELKDYIETGKGDENSFSIRWFEGKLVENFHYRELNDDLFLACVQDEIGTLFRFDPSQENCFWFALSQDKCISVWLSPDKKYGDSLYMKLEQRAEDGSMGPHCELICGESYATANLSREAICSVLEDVYGDAGLEAIAKEAVQELSEKVMVTFGLRKKALLEQIESAETKKSSLDVKPSVSGPSIER